MKLTIQNFKNILSGEINLDEKKLNVVFGVSGVGKSSIAESLNPANYEGNRSYLSLAGDPKSFIDGVVPAATDVITFSPSKRILIREAAEAEDGYDLLVDERETLENAEKDLAVLLDGFLAKKNEWDQAINSLRSLNKELKNKVIGKEKNQLQKASLIRQFLEACENGGKSTRVVKEIETIGAEKAHWINDGFGFIKVDNTKNKQYCPYCEKQMGETLRRRAKRFHLFEVDAVVNVGVKPTVVAEFGNPTSMASERSDVLHKAIGLVQLVDEYDDLCSLFEQIKAGSLSISSRLFRRDYPHLYERYPEIKAAMGTISEQYVAVKVAQAKAKRSAANAIKRKLNFICKWLERFGIPYKVEYETSNHKIIGARIVHKRNVDEAMDDSDRLSEGEKTIVAFILFALKASMAADAKLVVLDDPISNFNNERKQDLLALIQSQLSNRTIMLLTYDQAFVKIALGQQHFETSAQFISNEGGYLKSKPITKSDFLHIADAASLACVHCKESSYLRKIANLRYFYELKQHDGKTRPVGEIAPKHVYGYLSLLLHGLRLSKEEFECQYHAIFSTGKISEDGILLQIEHDTQLALPHADYHSLHEGGFEDFEFWLEKAIVLREAASTTLKATLDNLVHLNSILAICLNPFEYATCSDYVSEELKRVMGPVSNLFPEK